jgi:hypothetical protein
MDQMEQARIKAYEEEIFEQIMNQAPDQKEQREMEKLGRHMATQQGERAKKRGENWTEADTEKAFKEFMNIRPSQKKQKEDEEFARMLAKNAANRYAKERADKAQAGKGRRRGTRKGGKRHRRTRKA